VPDAPPRQIGRDILDRQAEQGWGRKVVERLAHDLREVFPDLGGFSRANLMYMRVDCGAVSAGQRPE